MNAIALIIGVAAFAAVLRNVATCLDDNFTYWRRALLPWLALRVTTTTAVISSTSTALYLQFLRDDPIDLAVYAGAPEGVIRLVLPLGAAVGVLHIAVNSRLLAAQKRRTRDLVDPVRRCLEDNHLQKMFIKRFEAEFRDAHPEGRGKLAARIKKEKKDSFEDVLMYLSLPAHYRNRDERGSLGKLHGVLYVAGQLGCPE